MPCTPNDRYDDTCAPCKRLCGGEYNAQYGSCPGNLLQDTIVCSVDNYTIADVCPANYYQVGYGNTHFDASRALVRLPGLTPYVFGLAGTKQQMVLGVAPPGTTSYYAVAWSNQVFAFDMASSNMSATPIFTASRSSSGQIGSLTFSHNGVELFVTDGRQEGSASSSSIWRCGVIGGQNQPTCELYIAGNFSLQGSNDIPPATGCVRVESPYLICTFGGFSETLVREVSRVLLVHTSTVKNYHLHDANNGLGGDIIRFVSPPAVELITGTTRVYVMTSSLISGQSYAYQLWRYSFNSTWGLTSSVVLSSNFGPFTNNRFPSLVMRADTGVIIAYGSRENVDSLYVFKSPLYATATQILITEKSGDTRWKNMWFSMQTTREPGKPSKLYIADTNTQSVYQYTHCIPCPARSTSSVGSTGVQQCQCIAGTYRQIGSNGIGECIPCNNGGSSCGVGQYHVVGKTCSGFTEFDETCAPCRTQCALGKHLQGACDGSGTMDTVSCTACRTSCSGFLTTGCSIDCASAHSMWYQFNAYQNNISDASVNRRNLVVYSARGFPDAVQMDYTDFKTDGASVHFASAALGYMMVNFPTDPLMTLNLGKYAGWTIAVWVKTTVLGGPVITCQNTFGGAVLRMWVSNTHVTLTVRSNIPNSVTRELMRSRGSVDASGWQHVAVQIDGLIWRIFLDGVQSLPGVSLGVPTPVGGSSTIDLPHLPDVYLYECAVGRDVTQTIQAYYTGYLDDLRVVHRAMTSVQIAAISSGDRCCSSPSGYHLDNSVHCDGRATHDQVQCVPCRADCGEGRYVNNENTRCNGQGVTDAMYCDECQSCSTGTYMRTSCTGNTFSDTVQCSPCAKNTTSDCPGGHVLVNACTGFSVTDTAYCKQCDIDSSYSLGGFYIVGNSTPGMPCLNGAKDYAAAVCESRGCAAGFFQSRTCPSGVFSFNDIECSPCTVQCQLGEYISGQCTGKSLVDTSTCVKCTSCADGYFTVTRCDGTAYSDSTTCAKCDSNCPAGQYMRGDCVSAIRLCGSCSAACRTGFYESVPCTALTDRVCTPRITCTQQCPDGTYQAQACVAADSSPKFCTLCTKCKAGEYMVHACSLDSNTVCAPCKTVCPLLDSSNSITGECSGTGVWDSVVCYNSTTPLAGITPAGEYVTASTVLVRDASTVILGAVQSMDVSPDGVYYVKRYVTGVVDARLIIDVEIYPVDGVNSVRFTAFSTQSFSSVILEPRRSLSPIHSRFPSVSVNVSNGAITSNSSSVTIDQVWWASGTFKLLFTAQQVPGWIGYCWITTGIIDIGSCGTLASQPAYSAAVFSTVTANQACVRSWVPSVLLCLYLHTNTTHVYRIDETGKADSRSRMTQLDNLYSAVSPPVVYAQGHRLFVLGQHATNGVTQLFSFVFSDSATLVDPPSILFSGSLTGGWMGYIETPAQIIIRQSSNTLSVLVGPAFSVATSLTIVTNTAVFTIGSKVLLAVDGATYTYSFAARCPAGSTSPPGAISIASCLCGNGTYGIITNSESTCKTCANQKCQSGEYRTLSLCGGTQAIDTSCAPCTTVCPTGNYVKGACDGYSTNSTATCARCEKSCPASTYVDSSACTGLTTTDATACVPCLSSCPEGFFIQVLQTPLILLKN